MEVQKVFSLVSKPTILHAKMNIKGRFSENSLIYLRNKLEIGFIEKEMCLAQLMALLFPSWMGVNSQCDRPCECSNEWDCNMTWKRVTFWGWTRSHSADRYSCRGKNAEEKALNLKWSGTGWLGIQSFWGSCMEWLDWNLLKRKKNHKPQENTQPRARMRTYEIVADFQYSHCIDLLSSKRKGVLSPYASVYHSLPVTLFFTLPFKLHPSPSFTHIIIPWTNKSFNTHFF